MNAQFILENSDLLIVENCVIVNDVLFERLYNHEHQFRKFFSTDDYDYVDSIE